MVIECMPSPVHETVVNLFTKGFNAAESAMSSHGHDIFCATAVDYNDFHGAYDGSEKAADLAVSFPDHSGVLEPRFILEVGFSESYEQLVREARLWIEGTSTGSVCVLVNVQESPNYRCPTSHLFDEDFERLQLPRATTAAMFNVPPNQYGPASFKGFNWTGVITKAEVEVWRKDAVTGKARTDGLRMDILSSNPSLTFMASEFMELSPDEDYVIDFEWAHCRRIMKTQLIHLAKHRYTAMMKKCGERGHSGDPDYVL